MSVAAHYTTQPCYLLGNSTGYFYSSPTIFNQMNEFGVDNSNCNRGLGRPRVPWRSPCLARPLELSHDLCRSLQILGRLRRQRDDGFWSATIFSTSLKTVADHFFEAIQDDNRADQKRKDSSGTIWSRSDRLGKNNPWWNVPTRHTSTWPSGPLPVGLNHVLFSR